MVVDLNVFDSVVELRVLGDCYGRLAIHAQDNWVIIMES